MGLDTPAAEVYHRLNYLTKEKSQHTRLTAALA
jgi:hypothetical protein